MFILYDLVFFVDNSIIIMILPYDDNDIYSGLSILYMLMTYI